MNSLLATIGNTPLVPLATMSPPATTLLAKDERRNPGGSVKDRAALFMINTAIKTGQLAAGGSVVEPTSGNTGIGLALVCGRCDIRLLLTMPESMSVERRKLLAHLGAELVLTPADAAMTGAIEKARAISQESGAIILDQFANPANSEAHRQTTAAEIWQQSDGRVDILVAGIGTGGTITGTGERLKELNPALQVVGVEPAESAVLSGEKAGTHGIQGIGAGFVPDLVNLDLLDEVIAIPTETALTTAQQLARSEGLLCGISGGAAAAAALRLAERAENAGKTIVFILPDGGERYLSTALFGAQ